MSCHSGAALRTVILAQPESQYWPLPLLLPLLLPLPLPLPLLLPALFRTTQTPRHPDRSAQRAVEGPRISPLPLLVLFRAHK